MATVYLFGPLADVLGTDSVSHDIKQGQISLSQLLLELSERDADWQRYMQQDKLQITINRQFASPDSSVSDSDEVALIPLPGTV